MSQCLVRQVKQVEPLPENPLYERLQAGDVHVIVPAGQYRADDYFVHIPCGARLPPWLLDKMGLWDAESRQGRLTGERGSVVGLAGLGGLPSDGLAYTVHSAQSSFGVEFDDPEDRYHYVLVDLEAMHVPGFVVYLGEDAAPYLNIKFQPDHSGQTGTL